MPSDNKKFTLFRYDRADETILTDTLEILEPIGYLELNETIKRDLDVHGVFFEYASELGFINYLYTSLDTGLQVYAPAYDFLLTAYDEDGASTIVKLEIELFDTNEIIYELYLDFTKNGSPTIDPRNKIFSIQSSDRKPFLLTENQKKKVNVSNFIDIRMRQKSIEFTSQYSLDPNNLLFTELNAVVTPPVQWNLTEYNQAFAPTSIDGAPTLASVSNEPVYRYDENGTVAYTVRIAGSVDYGIIVGGFNTTLEFSLRDIANNIIYSDTDTVFVPAPTTILNFDFTVQGSNVITGSGVFAHIRLDLGQQGLSKDITFDGDISEGNLNLTTKVFGSPATAILLKQSFEDILDGLNQNFTFFSSIMDDLQDLGSIAVTLMRRVNPNLQPDINIDLSLDYQTHFAEIQKMFNLGYEINGNEIRIEDITYFYTDTIYTLPNEVTDVRIESFDTLSKSTFVSGYKTFKEKDLGTLNENQAFNSNRNYNLTDSPYSQKLDVRTEYVASNIIIEKVRREINRTFDDKVAVLTLNREEIESTRYSSDGSIDTYAPLEVVEGIEPFDIPSNDYFGLNGEDLINIRVSPRRLGERYVPSLRGSFFPLPDPIQIATFISGDPKTQLKVDNVEENSDIDLTTQNGLFAPKKISLETFFSQSQYNDLKANRKNTIDFDFEGINYQGFLIQVDYNRETTLATIELIQRFAPVP